MSAEPPAPSSSTAPPAVLRPGARCAVVLVLLLLGALILWAGCNAISQRHWEMRWKSSAQGSASHSVLAYDGAEAVRAGIGLSSLGLMNTLYGVGLMAGFFRAPTRGSPFTRTVGWLAFACLLATIVCFFPPWRLRSIPFFGVLVVVLAAVVFGHRKSWARFVFPVLVGTGIVAGWMDPGTGAAIFLGVLAAFGMLVHVLVLCPSLHDRIFGAPGSEPK